MFLPTPVLREQLLSGSDLKHWRDVLDAARQFTLTREDGLLGRFEDAVEAAQHDERQDDLAVLGLLVVPPEQVGHRPNERRVVSNR